MKVLSEATKNQRLTKRRYIINYSAILGAKEVEGDPAISLAFWVL